MATFFLVATSLDTHFENKKKKILEIIFFFPICNFFPQNNWKIIVIIH